ncbi:MAG: hypothetical protein ACRELG_26415 [Gemmataceae bacterium]
MIRLAKWLSCMAALAGAALLAAPPEARADLEVQISTDGGNSWTTIIDVASGTTMTNVPGMNGSFSFLVLSASSNSPGTSSSDALLSLDMQFANGTSSTATLDIRVSDVGFISPGSGTDLELTSGSSGTVSDNEGTAPNLSVDALTYQSYADNSNTLFGTAGAATPGSQAAAFTPSADGLSAAFDSNASADFSSTSNTYSMTETYAITLAGSNFVDFASTTDPTTPAPASMMMAFTAVPFLGLGAWLRRGRNQGGKV